MFIPKETNAVKVPYFEDARSDDGWQGYATTKSVETLKREVMEAISRLGGNVFTFQQGTFAIGQVSRDGYQIKYSLDNPNGKIVPGVIEVAALPVREKSHHRAQYAVLHDKSLKIGPIHAQNRAGWPLVSTAAVSGIRCADAVDAGRWRAYCNANVDAVSGDGRADATNR